MAQGIIDTAQKGLNALAAYTEFLVFNVAEKDLLFVKHNNKEFDLARHAIDVTEGVVSLVLDIREWTVDQAGTLIDLGKVEFSGSPCKPHCRWSTFDREF